MKAIGYSVAVLLLGVSSYADVLLRPDDQITLPLPAGWIVGGDETGFPIQLVNEDLTAELQIFRSDIAVDEAITNGQQLRAAVDDIIDPTTIFSKNSRFQSNRTISM